MGWTIVGVARLNFSGSLALTKFDSNILRIAHAACYASSASLRLPGLNMISCVFFSWLFYSGSWSGVGMSRPAAGDDRASRRTAASLRAIQGLPTRALNRWPVAFDVDLYAMSTTTGCAITSPTVAAPSSSSPSPPPRSAAAAAAAGAACRRHVAAHQLHLVERLHGGRC